MVALCSGRFLWQSKDLQDPKGTALGVVWQGAQDGQAQGTQARTGPTE